MSEPSQPSSATSSTPTLDEGSQARAAYARNWMKSLAQHGQDLTDAELLEAMKGLTEQLQVMEEAEKRLDAAAKLGEAKLARRDS